MLEVVDAQASFPAEGGDVQALRGVSCRLEPGRILALVGANGSGKTTLGRLMCGMDVGPRGQVVVDRCDPASGDAERFRVRQLVGFCRQNPTDQIVSSNVHDEVAFGPRNLGLAEDEVETCVGRALKTCELSGFELRNTSALSGGEQQRLALAGVLAMEPRYLVLDEPTAQLDAAARPRFRALVRDLACNDGAGIALITHDPLEVLMADEVLVLQGGRAVCSCAPLELLRERRDLWRDVLIDEPYIDALCAVLDAGFELEPGGALPEPEELARWVVGHGVDFQMDDARNPGVAGVGAQASSAGLSLEGVSFSYGERRVLRQVDLEARTGRVLLLAGRSGSGKSTLARVAAGLYEPDEGNALLGGKPVRAAEVGLSFQNPEQQFFMESVRDEVAFAPRNLGCSEEEVESRALRAVEAVGLDGALLDRDPFTLSGGEARRVAIASVLSLEAGACFLDEPTAGLDAQGRRFMHRLVRGLAESGAAVVVISHDVGEWLSVADDVALIHEGGVSWSGLATALAGDAAPFEECGLEQPAGVRLAMELRRAGAGGAR